MFVAEFRARHWARTRRSRLASTRQLFGRVLCCFLLFGMTYASAQPLETMSPEPPSDTLPDQLQDYQTGVWLVTYGPGELYWQRFGHNGIWIRDQDLGLDHVFNFGFFDFAQQDFFLRFLQGRMLYFSAAQPAQSEFAQYIDENRSIRLQKLALDGEQSLRLADFLVREVQPQNRDYLYDYYWNNCSTRVRDALDLALGGRLSGTFSGEPAGQDFRDHTRRLTAGNAWLYLGLELVLGKPVDRSISRWDEFFIPAELADGVAKMTGASGLVQEDVLLYQSTLQPPPEKAPSGWWLYLLCSVAVVALLAFITTKLRPGRSLALARSWLTVGGLCGVAMVFFWFGTDHAVAAGNFNLLLFNPLFILINLARFRRGVAWFAVAGVALALLQSLVHSFLTWPPGQYTADVVAALGPVNLWAAWLCLRRPPANPHRGSGLD
jgi:hypothetical protein